MHTAEKPRSIMVVEDNPVLRWNATDLIKEMGCLALEAGNADEAIAMLETHSDVQIVFTDVEMPGSMDGLKLAALIRHRWPPIKLVVTSGRRVMGTGDLPCGGVFFAKPYSRTDVMKTFRDMLAA